MEKAEKLWGVTSLLNPVVEIVRGTGSYPFRAIQNDCTLRDGLGTPGMPPDLSLTLEEKLQIGLKLDDAHVYNIECRCARDEDFKMIKSLSHECSYSKVLGITDVFQGKPGIDRVADSEAFGAIIRAPPSESTLVTQKITGEELLKKTADSIEYAKSRGLWVGISATDATRADLDLLKRLAMTVEDAGAQRFRMPDTHGSTVPSAIKYMIKEIRTVVDLPLGVHCHNDFGLAVANTLAAVEAGAEVMSTTVLGLGGHGCVAVSNAPLEEVVVALKVLYGIDCGVKTEKLYDLCKFVEAHTGYKVGFSKPVMGEGLYVCDTVDALKREAANPFPSSTYKPELVGHKLRIGIGPRIDAPTVEAKLKESGLKGSAEQVQEIIKKIGGQSRVKKSYLTEDEFRKIAQETVK